jgi:alpha-L-arabinofuranosidase
MKIQIIGSLLVAACAANAVAGQATINVQVDKPGAKVSPVLWGIFFEDINCSADGGIYAEMVRNRSFQDSDKPEYWTVTGTGDVKGEWKVVTEDSPSAKNNRCLKVTVSNVGNSRFGVANSGYWGIPVSKGGSYRLSLQTRGGKDFTGPLTVSLESNDGSKVYAKQTLEKIAPDWTTHTMSLTTDGTDPNARLVISTTKTGTFWLDMVSLFPQKTWKDRANGLRPDLAGMLADMKPGFMRFPGGCWVEGETMDMAYRWKQTIGDISERRTQYNIWRYNATHGLGFHEYLQLCEDLNTEPLFVINVGMSHKENIPMDKMGEFVQDAMDAIEYCNGAADSKWGSVRAKNGHPAPFHLQYMEIGNENGGPAYAERYPLFVKAIKAKYPDMHLVCDVWGGTPANMKHEIVDEHYYDSPTFFMRNATRYDTYDRNGPKVYVGEYAVTKGSGLGNLRAAVGEAAFMTGMERNSDVVVMSSYAPLFVNVNHRGWNPDLIAYDNSQVYGIPSYYVQKMFSENRGDVILPVKVDSSPMPPEPFRGAIGVGTWRTKAEYKDIKVTKNGQTLFASDFSNGTKGWNTPRGTWKVENGVLQQTSDVEDARAMAGDESWFDYTYTVKARKISGDEGFLITFASKNGDKSWWNLGGWNNTDEGLEMDGATDNRRPLKIETGRWYDIRVELKGTSIKCFLDDKLVREATVATGAPATIYASATRDNSKGEIILKVVNAAIEPTTTEIKLNGAGKLSGPANVMVLSSANGTDENTLKEPKKIVPVSKTIEVAGDSIKHEFPANSVSVIRLKAN